MGMGVSPAYKFRDRPLCLACPALPWFVEKPERGWALNRKLLTLTLKGLIFEGYFGPKDPNI